MEELSALAILRASQLRLKASLIQTRLTTRFGIKHPIVCAPMALVTGGTLAAAVSRAGGLGIVGGGYAGTIGGEPDLEAKLVIAKAEKFGVGFITWALDQVPTMLTKALEHSPFCIFLSFGDPGPFADEIRQTGALLVCQVQCMADIDLALKAGAAAVVVQGTEAGGHGPLDVSFPSRGRGLFERVFARNVVARRWRRR